MTQREEFEKFWMKHCKENSLYCNLFRNGLDMYIDAFKGWQADKDITDEYNLPPYMKDCKVLMLPGEITGTEVYGDVKDKVVLIIDDICDGGRTFIELGKVLKERGASKVILYVTHGIFSQGKQVFEGIIDEVYAKHDWTIIA